MPKSRVNMDEKPSKLWGSVKTSAIRSRRGITTVRLTCAAQDTVSFLPVLGWVRTSTVWRRKKIIRKAEKNLLEVRIRHCTFTLKKLKIEEEDLTSQLDSKISKPQLSLIKTFLADQKQLQYERVKKRQKEKFVNLSARNTLSKSSEDETTAELQKRWVINKSSKSLDAASTSLLRKGLNFAVSPKVIPTEEIITATELACKNLDDLKAASLRSEVARSVKKKKNLKKRNVPYHELKALQSTRTENRRWGHDTPSR